MTPKYPRPLREVYKRALLHVPTNLIRVTCSECGFDAWMLPANAVVVRELHADGKCR